MKKEFVDLLISDYTDVLRLKMFKLGKSATLIDRDLLDEYVIAFLYAVTEDALNTLFTETFSSGASDSNSLLTTKKFLRDVRRVIIRVGAFSTRFTSCFIMVNISIDPVDFTDSFVVNYNFMTTPKFICLS